MLSGNRVLDEVLNASSHAIGVILVIIGTIFLSTQVRYGAAACCRSARRTASCEPLLVTDSASATASTVAAWLLVPTIAIATAVCCAHKRDAPFVVTTHRRWPLQTLNGWSTATASA